MNGFSYGTFLFNNCTFIISNFSEIAFKSSTLNSEIFYLSKVLTRVSKISDIKINIYESRTDNPYSHLEIVCLPHLI